MKRFLTMALAATLGLAAPASADLVNFEYTRTADPLGAGPQTYSYDMQFWIDLNDPSYTTSLGFRNFQVNVSLPGNPPSSQPKPFGSGFITSVEPGFTATEQLGQPNFDRIAPTAGGFWQPTASDFIVRLTGQSEVEGDMTWNYSGLFDVAVNTSVLSGTPNDPRGRVTSAPVGALTDFSNPSVVPLPAGLPLLLAGLGGLALLRRLRA